MNSTATTNAFHTDHLANETRTAGLHMQQNTTIKQARFFFFTLCVIGLWVTTPLVWAQNPGPMVLPFAGVGYAKSDRPSGSGFGTHAGARLLFSANTHQRFGLEISHMDLYALEGDGPDIRYHAVGVVVEQTLWKGFLMSVGTLGYVGAGDNDDNPFGIRTNLGWEHNYKNGLNPFFVYRADIIYDDPQTRVNSISIGVRVRF